MRILLLAAVAVPSPYVLGVPTGRSQPDIETPEFESIDRATSPEVLAPLVRELGADQREAIRRAYDEARKVMVKARAEVEVASIDLRRQLEADRPDARQVVALIEQISALEGKVRVARITAWLRVKEQLTAEQRARLARLAGAGDRDRDPAAAREVAEAAEQLRAEAEAIARAHRHARSEAGHARDQVARERALAERGRELAELEKARARLEADRAALERQIAELRRRGSISGALERELEASRAGSGIEGELDDFRRRHGVDVEGDDVLSLLVVESPEPAEVSIDGKRVGVTPLRLSVTPGRHVIEARWKNGKRVKEVVFEGGRDLVIQLSPQKPAD